MKKTVMLSAMVLSFLLSLGAQASEYSTAIGVKASTLGIGVELTGKVSDSMNIRLQGNGFNYNYNSNQVDLKASGRLKLRTFGAIFDYYPFGGKFRLSAGAYYNKNKISLTATPLVGTFVIGGTTYTAAQAGNVNASVNFKKFSPYIGLGWGNAISEGSPFGVSFELGAMYQGTPNVSLTTTGAAVTQVDIAKETKDIQNKVNNFKFYPVVAVGFNYAF